MNEQTPPTDDQQLQPEPPGGGTTVTRDLNAEDVLCVDCGYNLRGLEPDGRCPECGAAIQRALAPHLLVNASAAYINDLHRGLSLVLGALIGQIVLLVIGIALLIILTGLATTFDSPIPAWLPSVAQSSINIGSVILLIVGAIGWWLFTRPNPAAGRGDELRTLRRLLRTAVVVNIGVQLLTSIAELVTLVPPTMTGAGTLTLTLLGILFAGAGILAWIIQFFATMRYILALTPRIPDIQLRTRVRRDTWLLPLLFVVGFPCLGLGPLIAITMYALLLLETRSKFAYIRTRQRTLFESP